MTEYLLKKGILFLNMWHKDKYSFIYYNKMNIVLFCYMINYFEKHEKISERYIMQI